MGSLGISLDRCCYCCIYLFVYDVLICFYCVLCAKGYFYSRFFKKFGYSSYIFAAICKGGPFCHVMLRDSVYVLLL
jgi:hypothetical protein